MLPLQQFGACYRVAVHIIPLQYRAESEVVGNTEKQLGINICQILFLHRFVVRVVAILISHAPKVKWLILKCYFGNQSHVVWEKDISCEIQIPEIFRRVGG